MAKRKQQNTLKDVILEAVLEKKGQEIKVLDLRDVQQSIADYFIICHGNSNTQVDSISDFIERQARTELDEKLLHKEGSENSQWVLLDYGDIVIHVFLEEYRRFYNLEDLWADAKIELIEE
ncbi:MAG: ribosome silencing factor [Salinivirgaceae bacterium]|nr:ribosome silencing factor [Salinivirgaceae bacterium]